MHRLIFYWICLVLLCIPHLVVASNGVQAVDPDLYTIQPTRFKPAHFGTSGKALANYLRFPKQYKKKYEKKYKTENKLTSIVYCQVIVDATGVVSGKDCLSNEGEGEPDVYVDSVTAALEKTMFSPAKINNEAVKVSLDLSVIFLCVDGACEPVATLNYGLSADEEMGYEYISPQEVIEGKNWFERLLVSEVCDEEGIVRKECINAELNRFSIKVEVDASGQVSDTEVLIGAMNREQAFINTALEQVRASRYIPAFYRGQFISLPTLQTAMYHAEGFESDDAYEEILVTAKRQRNRFRQNAVMGEQSMRRMRNTFRQMHESSTFNMTYWMRTVK